MRMNSSPINSSMSSHNNSSSPTSGFLLSSSPTSTNQISPRRSRLTLNSSTKLINNSTSAEEEVLDQIAKDAEARLQAKRAARVEAREIRLREMVRQQKEMEETSDRHFDLMNSGGTQTPDSYQSPIGLARLGTLVGNVTSRNTPTLFNRESRTESYASSRRSSQDSLDIAGINNGDVNRELRHQIHEIEEKFRKAMINNAQLDNEKQAFVYQVDLYKDDLEEMEENLIRLQRDHKDKTKSFDQMKRDYERMKNDFIAYKAALEERDRLILDAGFVLIRNESDHKIRLHSQKVLDNGSALLNGDGQLINGNLEDVNDMETNNEPLQLLNNVSLISSEASKMLSDIPGSTLEAKLSAIIAQNRSLQTTVNDMTAELDEERKRFSSLNDSFRSNSNHMTSEMEAEIQREANRITNDLRYRLKKAEQENQTLTATVSRLETQVTRYKAVAEEYERDADEQKSEKRKAQRELRDLITRNEELESANNHLQKRIDKLKSNRILFQANGNVNSLPSTPTNHNNVPTSGPIFPNSSNSSTTNNTSSSSMSSTNDDSSNSTEYSSECSSMIAIE
ncbi:LRRFIP [Blomia tropicalis]|nr:LRRFIP [Blomia tropicalis]